MLKFKVQQLTAFSVTDWSKINFSFLGSKKNFYAPQYLLILQLKNVFVP